MGAWRISNVADHLAGVPVDHHDMRGTRNEDAPGPWFGREVVGASVPANAVLLDLEVLRMSRGRRRQREDEECGWCGKRVSGH